MNPELLAALIRWVGARVEVRVRPCNDTADEAKRTLRELLLASGLSEEEVKEMF